LKLLMRLGVRLANPFDFTVTAQRDDTIVACRQV
jgi:hypothetical protein